MKGKEELERRQGAELKGLMGMGLSAGLCNRTGPNFNEICWGGPWAKKEPIQFWNEAE